MNQFDFKEFIVNHMNDLQEVQNLDFESEEAINLDKFPIYIINQLLWKEILES